MVIEHDANARKLEAAEELSEMSTGSAWTAVATENAAGTTVADNKKATDNFLKTDAKIKIQHEPKKVLNVSQQAAMASAPKPAAATTTQVAAPKQANESGAMTAQSTEDGTILRWR